MKYFLKHLVSITFFSCVDFIKLANWQSFCKESEIMSEMLGNQYFLARNYSGAAMELEKALQKEPGNKSIRKKLIICLNQIGHIRKALAIFKTLVQEDAEYIINTDPVDDDCPCPELIYEAENYLPDNKNSSDFLLRLGMLWLYCDLVQSIYYFQKAHNMEKENSDIKSILVYLKNKVEMELSKNKIFDNNGEK